MIERAKAKVGKNRHYLPYLVWAVALGATVGSLVMSELLHFVPCVLCWWQRLLIYPLVVVVGVAILKRDDSWVHSTLVLSGIGSVVAFYHSLLQWGILPEQVAPCNAVVSCITKQIAWFGFITIPFMSFVAFGLIFAATWVYLRTRSR